MYPEKSIQIFEDKLRKSFDESFFLFAQWARVPVAERTSRALALLMKICDLLTDGEELIDSLKTAFPPISFSDSNSLRKGLSETAKYIKVLEPVQGSNREYKIETGSLLSSFTEDGEINTDIAEVAFNLIESEEKILKALTDACDKLLEQILLIQTEFSNMNKPEALTLLYAQEKGRYINSVWCTDGKTDEVSKFKNHIAHRYPWGYPATKSQIQSLYEEEYKEFVSTPLGQLYDSHGEDTVSLSVEIAESRCTRKELNEFFRRLLRLETYIELGKSAANEDQPQISIGTNVEHAETVVIQNAEQIPCKSLEVK